MVLVVQAGVQEEQLELEEQFQVVELKLVVLEGIVPQLSEVAEVAVAVLQQQLHQGNSLLEAVAEEEVKGMLRLQVITEQLRCPIFGEPRELAEPEQQQEEPVPQEQPE